MLIFPTTAVCNSFYRELMMEHFPNRYAKYLDMLQADSRLPSRLTRDKHGVPKGARKILELGDILRKGVVDDHYVAHPELPSAPLRAFSYTQAGGGASTGNFINAVFKCPDGYAGSYPRKLRRSGGYLDFENTNFNPFSNKIILMDEVHNLVKPSEDIMRNERRLEMVRHSYIRSRARIPRPHSAPLRMRRVGRAPNDAPHTLCRSASCVRCY